MLLFLPVLTIAVLGPGCPCFLPAIDPPDNEGILYNLVTSPIPYPPDLFQLQSAYESPQGQALISVFPGTTEPPGGLAVTQLGFRELPRALQENRPDFAVACGPDGTAFDIPVRVSLLLGEAVETTEGLEIPTLEVQTQKDGQVETVPPEDLLMEVTEDGLLIAHAFVDHFTPFTYKVGVGVLARIYKPTGGAYYVVGGDSVPTQMKAKNRGPRTIRLTPVVTTTGPGPGTLTYDNSAKDVAVNQVGVLGEGTCPCAKPGAGTFNFDLTGTWDLTDTRNPIPLDSSLVLFRTFRDVECIGLRTTMTVVLSEDGTKTSYAAKVEHATRATDYKYEDARFGTGEVEFQWSHADATCGEWDRYNEFYDYFWIQSAHRRRRNGQPSSAK